MSGSVIAIGLNHLSAPVHLRERFAFNENQIPAALRTINTSGLANEAVILSTCNRVEIYATTTLDPHQACLGLRTFLTEFHRCTETVTEEIYHLVEPASLEHLFKVASGLDSMVLGETEILGQLKKAYQLALESGHTGGRLNKAFQKAFNVAKQLRTETNIQRGRVSVGSVAVELAEKIFSALDGRTVLVIGAGDTSEKAARALQAHGARSILVSNRSHDRALALAKELGGRAVPFHLWADEFAEVDIAISSTSAPHYILNPAKLEPLMKLRKNQPLLLVDIAVPRDIDPEVNFLQNVYLYNIDDLQAIAADYMSRRQKEIAECENIIRQKAKALLGSPRLPQPPPSSRPAFGHE